MIEKINDMLKCQQKELTHKVADLSPIHFPKQSATDGTKLDLNIGETRVWRLDSGPNLQPCVWAFF